MDAIWCGDEEEGPTEAYTMSCFFGYISERDSSSGCAVVQIFFELEDFLRLTHVPGPRSTDSNTKLNEHEVLAVTPKYIKY